MIKYLKKLVILIYSFGILLTLSTNVYAMHIMEGFLPMSWAGFWYAMSLPFLYFGLRSIQTTIHNNPSLKMMLGLVGAFTFVLSALKIPSVTGSSSHPTGVGLGAILFGPLAMTVLGSIVLLFQAILLAHGGITTLGANIFSMAIVGPLASYFIFRATRKLKAPLWFSVFLSATLGDLLTYMMTSLQLALAFPAPQGGIMASFIKFGSVFAITQIPLAISEGILTVIIINILKTYNEQELQDLTVLTKEAK